MKSVILHIIYLLFICLFFGCGSSGENQVAKVHQAWNARYQYDLENRRIVSNYDNKQIGRTTGRDEWGRVDYDRYWVMRPFKGENLLDFHESKLDSIRDDRWEESNRNLIEARKIELSQIINAKGDKEDEFDPNDEISETESDEIFLPEPFLPKGIEIPSDGSTDADMNFGLPPFEEGATEVPNSIDSDAPSPFAPLPPL